MVTHCGQVAFVESFVHAHPLRRASRRAVSPEKTLPPLPGVLRLPSLHAIRLAGHQRGLRGTAPSQTSPPSSGAGHKPERPPTGSRFSGRDQNLQPWSEEFGAYNLPPGFQGAWDPPASSWRSLAHPPGGAGTRGCSRCLQTRPPQAHSPEGRARGAVVQDPGGAAGAGQVRPEKSAEKSTQSTASPAQCIGPHSSPHGLP